MRGHKMLDQGRNICDAVGIPVIGDADTGYGNGVSGQRTLKGYVRAGFAGLMVEDQRSPKRCGHTSGKEVISRADSIRRVKAMLEAREALSQFDEDIVIVARTDARATLGLAEAIARAQEFRSLGADIIFVEAPESRQEMALICQEVGGVQMANMLEHGRTPIISQIGRAQV